MSPGRKLPPTARNFVGLGLDQSFAKTAPSDHHRSKSDVSPMPSFPASLGFATDHAFASTAITRLCTSTQRLQDRIEIPPWDLSQRATRHHPRNRKRSSVLEREGKRRSSGSSSARHRDRGSLCGRQSPTALRHGIKGTAKGALAMLPSSTRSRPSLYSASGPLVARLGFQSCESRAPKRRCDRRAAGRWCLARGVRGTRIEIPRSEGVHIAVGTLGWVKPCRRREAKVGVGALRVQERGT